MFVEFDEGDLTEIESISPDKTIGIGRVPLGADPLEDVGEPFDMNRLLALIGQARDEFGERTLSIGLIQPPEGPPHLAIYDPDRRHKAMLLPCRVPRNEDGDES